VHFIEHFHLKGYEELLISSVERKPTEHTIFMLNRVVNGTTEPEMRQRYLAVLERAEFRRRRRETSARLKMPDLGMG
jgi:hypothetical protein